jgi:hypothetical protein
MKLFSQQFVFVILIYSISLWPRQVEKQVEKYLHRNLFDINVEAVIEMCFTLVMKIR